MTGGGPTRPESSMQDVADRAGVSVSTVSRALRQSPLVSADTRTRVLAAAAELSFAVSRAASSLASGKLGRVAVLVSGSLGAWFNGSILDGVYAALHDEGLELLIYRIGDVTDRAQFFATLPARRNADALIVASFALTAAEHERLRQLSMPLVYLNQQVPGATSVSIDDEAGARAGTRHLLDLGHRDIAFAGLGTSTGFFFSAARRIDGFRAELRGAGIPGADSPPLLADSVADGEQVMAQFLAADVPPTALMTESDELAMSVMAACNRMGLRVPDDVSVLGFDDHALAATFGLSTLAQPVDLLGRRAAALAVGLAEERSPGADAAVPVELVLPTRLMLRGSTARPRRTAGGS